jgi:hypothetical protein
MGGWIMLDSDNENEAKYELLADEEKKVEVSGNQRAPIFALPSEFMRVTYDGLNTVSVLSYSEQIPTLREMMNSVIASQLQYLIADIEEAIKANSHVYLRRAFVVMKKIVVMAVFGFLMVYGCMQLARLMEDLNDEDGVIMDNAFDTLITSCHSVFRAINGSCDVLANDPSICAEKPDNCPVANCFLVMNLLESCEYWDKRLVEDTHDYFPYSTNLLNRLNNCEDSGFKNYTDTCKSHYSLHGKFNGYLAAIVLVAIVGSAGVIWPIWKWCYEGDITNQFEEDEKERVKDFKFKDFLPAKKFEENPAFKLLLNFVTDEDVNVRDVLEKLYEYKKEGFKYSTQRFFQRPVENALRIEVEEEKAVLLRNVS